MSTILFKSAYRKLIDEDLEWLETTPRTLERDHVEMILEMEKKHCFAYTLPSSKERRDSSFPKVVCICGSSRFADLHAIKRWEFEQGGEYICLMINYLSYDYAIEQGFDKPDHIGEQANLRETLDELHFRKIDLCDKVFVVNKNGYIGDSTKKEIEYAEKLGKPVEYLEEVKT